METRTMDAFDRHLLQFFLTWAPFGGPSDEDTFPRFGFGTAQGWQRFETLASAADLDLTLVDADDAALLRRAMRFVAEHRLAFDRQGSVEGSR